MICAQHQGTYITTMQRSSWGGNSELAVDGIMRLFPVVVLIMNDAQQQGVNIATVLDSSRDGAFKLPTRKFVFSSDKKTINPIKTYHIS